MDAHFLRDQMNRLCLLPRFCNDRHTYATTDTMTRRKNIIHNTNLPYSGNFVSEENLQTLNSNPNSNLNTNPNEMNALFNFQFFANFSSKPIFHTICMPIHANKPSITWQAIHFHLCGGKNVC